MKMKKLPVKYFLNYMLRPVEESDVKDYFLIGSDEETVKFLSWYPFKHVEEAVIHFNNLYFSGEYRDEPQGYAIVDLETNRMIGVIDFHTTNKILKSAHIGYLLKKEYWNQGIITKAVEIMLEVGFKELKLEKIVVRTIKENYASRKVCEKNNFRLHNIKKNNYYHGKTRTYYDVYKYVMERKVYYDSKAKGNL